MRGHHVEGEFDGRGGIIAYNIDSLVGEGCGTQGAVLRCFRSPDPSGFVAPAGTRVVQVEDEWLRVSDGRLYRVRYHTVPGPWTVEPVKGFED